MIAPDGNLTEALLAEIAASPLFREAELKIAPARAEGCARCSPIPARRSISIPKRPGCWQELLVTARPRRPKPAV